MSEQEPGPPWAKTQGPRPTDHLCSGDIAGVSEAIAPGSPLAGPQRAWPMKPALIDPLNRSSINANNGPISGVAQAVGFTPGRRVLCFWTARETKQPSRRLDRTGKALNADLWRCRAKDRKGELLGSPSLERSGASRTAKATKSDRKRERPMM